MLTVGYSVENVRTPQFMERISESYSTSLLNYSRYIRVRSLAPHYYLDDFLFSLNRHASFSQLGRHWPKSVYHGQEICLAHC